ncbi:hypothetical protein QE152_g22999 [Popillia japonica]|uniref:Uncharacterized protein n=1 Tax=Popillia japonica TaxID=7064 RepID=A0AAW1KJQ6_POPJA
MDTTSNDGKEKNRHRYITMDTTSNDGKEKNRHRYIASWNVRGLCYAGALKNLEAEAEKYNIEILAIQETKLRQERVMFCWSPEKPGSRGRKI